MPNLSAKQVRQAKVIEMLGWGWRQKDIAKQLEVSEQTICQDVKDIGELPLVNEILRRQLKDIDNLESDVDRVKYRGELLKLLRPQKHDVQEQTTITYRIIDEVQLTPPNEGGEVLK